MAQVLQIIEDEIIMWTAVGYRHHLGAVDSLRLFVVLVVNYVYGVITTTCESGEGTANGNLWITVWVHWL